MENMLITAYININKKCDNYKLGLRWIGPETWEINARILYNKLINGIHKIF